MPRGPTPWSGSSAQLARFSCSGRQSVEAADRLAESAGPGRPDRPSPSHEEGEWFQRFPARSSAERDYNFAPLYVQKTFGSVKVSSLKSHLPGETRGGDDEDDSVGVDRDCRDQWSVPGGRPQFA